MRVSKAATQVVLGATAASAISLPNDFFKRDGALGDFVPEYTSLFPAVTLEQFVTNLAHGLIGPLDNLRETFSTNIPQILTALPQDLLSILPSDLLSGLPHIARDVQERYDSGTEQNQVRNLASAGDHQDEHLESRAVCTKPFVRVEWRRMKEADKLSYVNAIKCLYNAPPRGIAPPAKNRYEEIVWVHQQMTPYVHGATVFKWYHRYISWVFSRMLREECGYAAPLPWWDETKDSGNFGASGLFTADYFGALPPKPQNGAGWCIINGLANFTCHIGPGGTETARCIARGENTGSTRNTGIAYVNQCLSLDNFSDHESCVEMGPHGNGHNGIGPTMADVAAAPCDSIFWQHHGFVDWIFWKWEQNDRRRVGTVGGCARPGNNCPPLTPDTVLSSMGIRPDVTVRDMMDTNQAPLCYTYDSD